MEQSAFDEDRKEAGTGSSKLTTQDSGSVSTVTILRVGQGLCDEEEDVLAVEEPLEIQISFGPAHARQMKAITVTMRTPGRDEELAAGFLLTEGVVDDSAQIVSIGAVEDHASTSRSNTVRVDLASDVEIRMATLERNFYTTSSCGICGKASLLALRSVCPPRYENGACLAAATIYGLPNSLRDAQAVFAVTGGLHGAALFTLEGDLILAREDVGRHNAVDKLLGHQFLADSVPLRNQLLMLSGRVSFELMQKAVMAGVPVVVAVGAPSSLAVKVAQDFDVTLIAFLREQRFNVYHGGHRISGLPSSEVKR